METISESRWRRQRRNALVYLYAVFLLTGVCVCGLLWFSSDANVFPRVELLYAIAVSLGFMWYCTADARLLGKPLLPLARVGIFVL